MSKSHVAMYHSVCPVCGNKHGESVLLDKRLKQTLEGPYSDWGMCKECQEYIDQGCVALIEIDEEKTKGSKPGTVRPEDAYRTGRVFFVDKDAYKRNFNLPPKEGMAFVDKEVGDMVQKVYNERTDNA